MFRSVDEAVYALVSYGTMLINDFGGEAEEYRPFFEPIDMPMLPRIDQWLLLHGKTRRYETRDLWKWVRLGSGGPMQVSLRPCVDSHSAWHDYLLHKAIVSGQAKRVIVEGLKDLWGWGDDFCEMKEALGCVSLGIRSVRPSLDVTLQASSALVDMRSISDTERNIVAARVQSHSSMYAARIDDNLASLTGWASAKGDAAKAGFEQRAVPWCETVKKAIVAVAEKKLHHLNRQL